jgi:hypothetical protein
MQRRGEYFVQGMTMVALMLNSKVKVDDEYLNLNLDMEIPLRESKFKTFLDLLEFVSLEDYLEKINTVRNLTKQGLDKKIKQWRKLGDIQDVEKCSYRYILYHLCQEYGVKINQEDFDLLSKTPILNRWCLNDELCLKTEKDLIRIYKSNHGISIYRKDEHALKSTRIYPYFFDLNSVGICTDAMGLSLTVRNTETLDFNTANEKYYNLSLLERHYMGCEA